MPDDDGSKYSVFPYLEIKDFINVFGDFYSYNETKMKAFTKLEMKVDFYAVEKAALANAEAEFDAGFTEYTCVIADNSEANTILSFSSKTKEELLADFISANPVIDEDFY